MKKNTTIALLLLLVINGFSQIEKKTFLLGGNATAILNTSNYSYFYLNPNSGIFLTDKFCLGLSAPLFLSEDDFDIGFAPYVRYYLKAKENKSTFFLSSIDLAELIQLNSEINNNVFFSLGVGHVWLLNKSVGFETIALFDTNFDSMNFGLLLGFEIYFNKEDSTKGE